MNTGTLKLAAKSAIFLTSSSVKTLPLGLQGRENITHPVVSSIIN